MGVHTKSHLIQLEGMNVMIFDPATVSQSLPAISDEKLNALHASLSKNKKRTSEQDSLLAKISNELENRVEDEAKFEFGESNAKDIINFLTANAERKKTKHRLRIQWNVALDVLIDRYPRLARRADDYIKKNPLLNWHRVFYQLVTDSMANQAGK